MLVCFQVNFAGLLVKCWQLQMRIHLACWTKKSDKKSDAVLTYMLSSCGDKEGKNITKGCFAEKVVEFKMKILKKILISATLLFKKVRIIPGSSCSNLKKLFQKIITIPKRQYAGVPIEIANISSLLPPYMLRQMKTTYINTG